jgi:phospholipase C
MCLSEYSDPQAPVPWGPENAHQNLSLLVEEGFKQVRGQLSEGRFLVFESLKLALTNVDGKFVDVSPATAAHENIRQRWILHSVSDPLTTDTFYIQSALDKTYITSLGSLTSDMKDAQAYTISYTPNGATYSLSRSETGKGKKGKSFLSFGHGHGLSLAWEGAEAGKYKIFSVSYH